MSWLKRQKKCPHCGKGRFRSVVNREKIREINELRIRCPYSKKGCDWEGELGTLNDHLQSEKGCGYVTVECTNAGKYITCKKKVERKHLASHMENECKYRPYSCEYCGYKDTFKVITTGDHYEIGTRKKYCSSHYDKCEEYPLECTNKCGKVIKRKHMKAHHSICHLEPLNCPFKDAGCTSKLLRQDMEKHIESSTQEHLLMVFKSHQELKTRLQELEKQK